MKKFIIILICLFPSMTFAFQQSCNIDFGNVAITGGTATLTSATLNALSVAADTDVTVNIGRIKLSAQTSVGLDRAVFSHYDMDTSSYALVQTSSGLTALNAKTGQTIQFNINSASVGAIGATGFTMGKTVFNGSARVQIEGDVSVNGTQYVTTLNASSAIVNQKEVWGQWYVTYNATVFVPTGAYTTYNVGILVKSTENITVGTDGIATINVGGLYRIVCDINLTKENSTDDIEGGISINGANPDDQNEFRFDATASGYTYVGCSMYRRLVAGDVVCLKIKNISSATRNITLRSSKMNLLKY